jgi:uncharacterized protein (DUF362 family)
MTKVALCACPDYDAANVVSAVDRAVGLCGGMETFVRPGQRVLLKPALTILDGVWGMQGRGPNNGTPCHSGFLAASRDPLAMDLALAPLLGVHPASFPLYDAAVRRGFARFDGADTQMVGDDPKGLIPKDLICSDPNYFV